MLVNNLLTFALLIIEYAFMPVSKLIDLHVNIVLLPTQLITSPKRFTTNKKEKKTSETPQHTCLYRFHTLKTNRNTNSIKTRTKKHNRQTILVYYQI